MSEGITCRMEGSCYSTTTLPLPPPPETVSCPEVSRTHPLPRGGADTLTPKGWGRQDTRNRARGTERACEPEIEEVVEIKI